MRAILATIQDTQITESKGYFISFHDDFAGIPKGLAPVSFYLTEEHGLQDLQIHGELLNKLDWLKGAIEFIQMLQKH